MKLSTPSKKPWPLFLALLGFALAAVATFVGWNIYQKRYPSWYEEVQLSDGRIITIHQKREYFTNYGTAQSWLTLDLPELGGKKTWHSRLMPQRVDVSDGQVYVFGIPRGDLQYSIYQYPKNYMVAFKWGGSTFERIPFLSVPIQLRSEENVYPCIPSKLDMVLIAQKQANWCPPMGDDKQFGKKIVLEEYQAAAIRYARRSGGKPISD